MTVPKQSLANEIPEATKPPLAPYELMHTPIDFFCLCKYRLKIDNLTKEVLRTGLHLLLKDTCHKLCEELETTTMEECYRALLNNLTRTILRSSDVRVEDLQLGVESYQKKLNLTNPRTRDVDMSRRPTYTTLLNPQDVIYKDKPNYTWGITKPGGEEIEQIGLARKDPHHDHKPSNSKGSG
ncbi:hypothetical protein Tco_0935963 [Tanacetum coccineum]